MAVLRGSTRNGGIAGGKAAIVRKPSDLKNTRIGNIVIVDSVDPKFISALFRASGILIEKEIDSPREALIARQLSVPMVTGVSGARSRIKDGCFVTLNGNTGEVIFSE